MIETRLQQWTDSEGGLPYEPYLISASQAHGLARQFQSVGAVVLGPPALDPSLFQALVAESEIQKSVSAWDLRGNPSSGTVEQDTVRAQLGPIARELMAASATRALLQAITDRVVIPGWSATCLTFYDRPGQHLGAHRDKQDACHFAMLVYLDARWPPGSNPGPGLQLHIRDQDDVGVMLRVTAKPNRVILLYGSRLTHFRPPLADGEAVSLLAGCFEVAP